MSNTHPTIDRIGAELVDASRGDSEESLPLSTRLFPYIFVASRRMSLRSISRWLADKHGVQLSAAAISRALANPNLHLDRLADSIAAPARYVASAYGLDPLDLLYGEEIKNGPSRIHFLANHIHKQPESETDIARWGELQDLESVWEPIPHEVQLLLEPYLREQLQSEDFGFGEDLGFSDDASDESTNNQP